MGFHEIKHKTNSMQVLFLETAIELQDAAEVFYVYFPISSHRALKRHILKGGDFKRLIIFTASSK